MFNTV